MSRIDCVFPNLESFYLVAIAVGCLLPNQLVLLLAAYKQLFCHLSPPPPPKKKKEFWILIASPKSRSEWKEG